MKDLVFFRLKWRREFRESSIKLTDLLNKTDGFTNWRPEPCCAVEGLVPDAGKIIVFQKQEF